MKRAQTQILFASTVAVAIVLALALRVGSSGCATGTDDDGRVTDANDGAPRLAAIDTVDAGRAAQAEDFVPGFFQAPIGSEFVYEFDGTSHVAVELEVDAQIAEETLGQRVLGRMQLVIAAREKGQHVAVVSFPATSVEVNAGGQVNHHTLLEEALAKPCLVRVADDGKLLGYRFEADVPAEARNWIRNQVALFHFEVEPGNTPTWEREQRDPTGTSRVRYVRAPETASDEVILRKSRLTCATPAGTANNTPIDVQSEVTSDTAGVLSKSLMCVRTAAYDEKMVFPVASVGVTTRLAQSGSLRLVRNGRVAPGTLPLIDWNESWESVTGAEQAASLADNGEAFLRAKVLEGVTLEGLLSEIDALARAKPQNAAALMDARHLLAELLVDQPALAEKLAELVPTMHPATADVVLGAAGAAGTEQAQTLLADVLSNSTLSPGLRQSSLDALFQLTRPTDKSYDTLSKLVSDASVPAGLRANGMLTYGALASMDGASDAARAAAVAGLVQLEQQAKNEQRLTHWLHALGNTGSSDVFGAARPYLEHADPALRSAAADAVRGATTTEAREALARHALSDADTGVRKKCAAILADRSDAGSLATVRQVLEHEASVDVRRAAVDALARRVKTDANAKQLLIYVAGNDPSTELRAQAAAAL